MTERRAAKTSFLTNSYSIHSNTEAVSSIFEAAQSETVLVQSVIFQSSVTATGSVPIPIESRLPLKLRVIKGVFRGQGVMPPNGRMATHFFIKFSFCYTGTVVIYNV